MWNILVCQVGKIRRFMFRSRLINPKQVYKYMHSLDVKSPFESKMSVKIPDILVS